MIDPNALEEQCLKCNGTGGIENTTWYHNWAMRNSKLQILKTKDEINIIKEAPDQPDESVFFFCRNCHGRGKILTDEGKLLMEFVRFWINPNY
jgi:DnaJ-class molecular chaperone